MIHFFSTINLSPGRENSQGKTDTWKGCGRSSHTSIIFSWTSIRAPVKRRWVGRAWAWLFEIRNGQLVNCQVSLSFTIFLKWYFSAMWSSADLLLEPLSENWWGSGNTFTYDGGGKLPDGKQSEVNWVTLILTRMHSRWSQTSHHKLELLWILSKIIWRQWWNWGLSSNIFDHLLVLCY